MNSEDEKDGACNQLNLAIIRTALRWQILLENLQGIAA